MNCKNAESFMNALLDNESQVNDNFDFISHIETCENCKTKWELSKEIKSKLKDFTGSIKASSDFRKRILNKINEKETRNIIYLKPLKSALIAASVVFLLGLGWLMNTTFSQLPTLSELHNDSKPQVITTDINAISSHTSIKLAKSELSAFEEASFKLEGASKYQKLFNNIALISLRNKNGEKISICYLPESYKISNCHKMEINGQVFFCGKNKNCHFAYWKKKGTTIALVSDSLSTEEMIYLALPMV